MKWHKIDWQVLNLLSFYTIDATVSYQALTPNKVNTEENHLPGKFINHIMQLF